MSIYLHHRGQGPDTVHLESWSICRFEGGATHFVGHSRESFDGRVSTEIVEFDVESRTARTASGRRYVLLGPSGYDADAEYVWKRVASALGSGQAWTDVTEQLIPGSRAPRQRYKWPEDEW
jgi:hypothetical protein